MIEITGIVYALYQVSNQSTAQTLTSLNDEFINAARTTATTGTTGTTGTTTTTGTNNANDAKK